jgi:hypothetical protein
MKPTVKIYLKPKYKIGSMLWSLNFGFSISDYFQNPTDDKLRSDKVIGYSVSFVGGKSKITAYHLENKRSESGDGYWDFVSKKAIKEHLKKEAINSYRFGTGFKPNIEKFNLTTQERELYKTEPYLKTKTK